MTDHAETQTERVDLEAEFALAADDMAEWAELTYPLAAETAAIIDEWAGVDVTEEGTE